VLRVAHSRLWAAAVFGEPKDGTRDRRPAYPESAALVDGLRAAGVPAVISGAGPTVLALTTSGTLPSGLDLHGFTVMRLPVDPFGVTVEAS